MDTSSSKKLMMMGLLIGSLVGGYIPCLFGAGFLSMWGIVGSMVGGVLGIWIAYKVATG